MEDKTKSTIDSLLAKHRKRKEEDKKIIGEMKKERESFVNDFYQLRDNTIDPVMKEIGDYLESNGHKYYISKTDEGKDSLGKPINATIHMNIYPDGEGYGNLRIYEYPYISFIAESSKKVVSLHTSTSIPMKGGVSGAREQYKISAISKDFVEKIVAGFLEQIL